MEIRITGKKTEVTEAIKEWVFRKVSKLEHYAPRLVESHVIIKREKYLYIAELTLLGSHLHVYGEGKDKENLYTAIDTACRKVATQLRKYRERIRDHHSAKETRHLAQRLRGPVS
ncbi:MAG: ribosome-associated translation inhibitor RaiA [Candidatus Omnitrophica bacterium]|nr:ribosome-associated translation inhibitor RaiA [Candidatus Omnitrophota bacterium]